ncbi:MAG: choice-of-anchor E domain-containing protein [Acidimicrobiia bacterium]|nr:choice-of-anchor E domain-containing protein [Acidimicrobiia bacterium]
MATAVLVLVSVFAVMGSAPAHAAEVSFSDTIPIQNTNWNQTVTIMQFDPAQGTLQSVEVTITGELFGSSQVENLDPGGPTTSTLDLGAAISVDGDPGAGSITISTNPTSSNTVTLAAFDGLIDFGGASGATFADLSASETQSQTITDAGVLAGYTGTGTVSLDASGIANSFTIGGGNIAALFDTDAGATVTVRYTFQPLASAAIDIEKATNGEDADAAPGPTVTVGSTVNWTYVVTNTGSVALTNVAVSDDQGVVVSCPQTTLAIAESMTCTASGTATAGQYENIGAVTAEGPGGEPATDSDLSHYVGEVAAAPAIDIEKTPDSQIVAPGSDVTFTIVVTNTGTADLSNVVVADPLAPDCDATIGDLAVGASISYDCTVASVTTGFTNVATVTGEGPGGGPVTDQDDAVVDVVGLTLVKTVNVTTATVGDSVTYTYVITNTGTVTLTDLTLTDDKVGTVSLPGSSLAPGESMTATGTYVVTAADAASPPLINIATATGTDPDGNPVTDTDDAEVPTLVLQVAAATLPKTGGQADLGPASALGASFVLVGFVLVLTAATRRRQLRSASVSLRRRY